MYMKAMEGKIFLCADGVRIQLPRLFNTDYSKEEKSK